MVRSADELSDMMINQRKGERIYITKRITAAYFKTMKSLLVRMVLSYDDLFVVSTRRYIHINIMIRATIIIAKAAPDPIRELVKAS